MNENKFEIEWNYEFWNSVTGNYERITKDCYERIKKAMTETPKEQVCGTCKWHKYDDDAEWEAVE